MLLALWPFIKPVPTQAPAGFHEVTEAQFDRATRESPYDEFMVSLVDDRLLVESRVDWVKRTEGDAEAAGPVHYKLKVTFSDSWLYWNPGGGLDVGDGWLVGADNGEFGGGLVWIPRDAKSYKTISLDNTAIVGKTSKGIFAVQTFEPMSDSYGTLVEVARSAQGWTLRKIVKLDQAPSQILQEGDHFVYAQPEYVTTLETDGSQRHLADFKAPFAMMAMVMRKNGDLWLAGLGGLLELAKTANGGYKPSWFVPNQR
jgi:hypothetical protein